MRIERQKEVDFYLTNFLVSLAVKIIGKWKMKFLTPSTQKLNEEWKKDLKIFQLKLYLFMRNQIVNTPTIPKLVNQMSLFVDNKYTSIHH